MRGQSHLSQHFDDNPRLRPSHGQKKGVADRANVERGSEKSAKKGRRADREAPTTRLPSNRELRRESEGRGEVVASPS